VRAAIACKIAVAFILFYFIANFLKFAKMLQFILLQHLFHFIAHETTA